MKLLTLEEAAVLIINLPAADLFDDPAKIDEREKFLTASVHPDRFPDPKDAMIAADLLRQVQEKAAIVRTPPVLIKGAKHTYTLGERFAAGDVADVYHATADGQQYVAKATRVPAGDAMAKREYETLAMLHKAAGDTTYRRYFPIPVETIPVRGRKFHQRVNVLADDGRTLHTLTDVIAKHRVLEGRHVAWMFKRLLTALGFAHQQGVVHGCIIPDHLLYDTGGHGLVICGWGQSVKIGEPVKTFVKSWEWLYPPELKAKAAAGPAFDIFMAAKCMAQTLDPDMLSKGMITEFLRSCVMPGAKMRPSDAWALLDDFDELLRGLYGKPQFVPLSM